MPRRVAKAAHLGFTIVELLVGVSILGILMVTASSIIDDAFKRARRVEAETHLKAMHMAILSYEIATGSPPLTPGTDFTCLGTGGFQLLPAAPPAVGNYGYCKWVLANPPAPGKACNNTNVVGFEIADCANVRFQYSYVFWPNPAGQPGGGWYVEATSTQYFYRDCPAGADTYIIRGNGITCRINDSIKNDCDGSLPDITQCPYEAL